MAIEFVVPCPAARPSPLPMPHAEKISIVLPTRNGADRIAGQVQRVIDLLAAMNIEGAEIIIVDDGSIDATSVTADGLCVNHSRVRVMRHARPRGMEAAGQTGLERSTGDLVFIQEDDADIRGEDFRRLYQTSRDRTIVAARAESVDHPIAPALLRRLRAAGTTADLQLQRSGTDPVRSGAAIVGLQMIRRSHLQSLVGIGGEKIPLRGQTTRWTSLRQAG